MHYHHETLTRMLLLSTSLFFFILPPVCNAFSLPHLLPRWTPSKSHVERQSRVVQQSIDGSEFIWVLEDDYSGKTFFDGWEFFSDRDPTNGRVNYQNREDSFRKGLAYVDSNDNVIMKADNTTWLTEQDYRDSVRIHSHKLYNSGHLFILDVNTAPWGCAVWPAWWTVGHENWPYTGEIDIIEGVHDNEHNQVAWHTGPDCYLDTQANFSGTYTLHDGDEEPRAACNGNINNNAGCSITQWSKASYGANFDATGGGAFVMKWDEDGIAIWSFYRAAIPIDITEDIPTPTNWDIPVALLTPTSCDLEDNFSNHRIVFDITFCGDWAGNSYATTDCPGTCPERLMDPNNFNNAIWSINSVKVYKKLVFEGSINAAEGHRMLRRTSLPLVGMVLAMVGLLFLM